MKLALIFAAHWRRFASQCAYLLRPVHHRAARAVVQCRTAALGGKKYACDGCEKHHYAYHSCNHRNCPQCGGGEQQEWAAAQEQKLLPVRYFFLTVTVPETLRPFIYKEQKWFYNLFFAAVSGALKDLGADPRLLGGQIGFTAVLHTWTRQMEYHPHLHIVIPGIALSKDGLRIHRTKGKKYLFPTSILNVVFRNRIKMLIQKKDETEGSSHLKAIAPQVWKQPWVVNAKAVGKGTAALRYLARYVFKSAVSEPRLLGETTDGKIRLNCQNSKTGQWKKLHLEPHEFLRRWCQHVLPKGLMRVRHYGFLSAAGKKKRERVEQILGSKAGQKVMIPPPSVEATTTETLPAAAPKPPRVNPKCPCCGREMRWEADLKPEPWWLETWEPIQPSCQPKLPRPPNEPAQPAEP